MQDVPVYVKVKGLGSLLTDAVVGFNYIAQKFYKMALYNGKFRVIESTNKDGPWTLKNDGSASFKPSRIVIYKNED